MNRLIAACLVFGSTVAFAQSEDVPDRADGEGVGQFERLVLRGGYLIDGTGAPPQGPVDIVVVKDRITEIKVVGVPKLPIDPEERPEPGDYELDLEGHYILPGFVDLHSHIHDMTSDQGVPPEYIFKLQMAHGTTSIRELGNHKPVEWIADLKQRSNQNGPAGLGCVDFRDAVRHRFGHRTSPGATQLADDATESLPRESARTPRVRSRSGYADAAPGSPPSVWSTESARLFSCFCLMRPCSLN